MTVPFDAYWDELGVAWCAIHPNFTVVASRLEARLRWQSRCITTGLVIGLPLGAAGVLLGVATICIGWSSGAWNFVTRGSAIVAISAIVTFAAFSLLPVRSLHTSAPAEMIELAIDRAQRTLSLIRMGLYACVIAAVFGLVGTAIRTHLAKMSPIVDLVILALTALVLLLYSRQIKGEREKYLALKRALAVDGDA
jgi:hypothetical protein